MAYRSSVRGVFALHFQVIYLVLKSKKNSCSYKRQLKYDLLHFTDYDVNMLRLAGPAVTPAVMSSLSASVGGASVAAAAVSVSAVRPSVASSLCPV